MQYDDCRSEIFIFHGLKPEKAEDICCQVVFVVWTIGGKDSGRSLRRGWRGGIVWVFEESHVTVNAQVQDSSALILVAIHSTVTN